LLSQKPRERTKKKSSTWQEGEKENGLSLQQKGWGPREKAAKNKQRGGGETKNIAISEKKNSSRGIGGAQKARRGKNLGGELPSRVKKKKAVVKRERQIPQNQPPRRPRRKKKRVKGKKTLGPPENNPKRQPAGSHVDRKEKKHLSERADRRKRKKQQNLSQ